MNLPLSDVQMSIQSKTKLFADPEDEQRSHRIRKTILEAGNQLRDVSMGSRYLGERRKRLPTWHH